MKLSLLMKNYLQIPESFRKIFAEMYKGLRGKQKQLYDLPVRYFPIFKCVITIS